MLGRKSDSWERAAAGENRVREPSTALRAGGQAVPAEDPLARFRAVLLRLSQRPPRPRIVERPASISTELEATLLLLSTQHLGGPSSKPH